MTIRKKPLNVKLTQVVSWFSRADTAAWLMGKMLSIETVLLGSVAWIAAGFCVQDATLWVEGQKAWENQAVYVFFTQWKDNWIQRTH